MQCTTKKYPCDYKSVGINNLDGDIKKFKCDVGLSDHTGSIFPSLYALSKDIGALEVHVTFDKEMFGLRILNRRFPIRTFRKNC